MSSNLGPKCEIASSLVIVGNPLTLAVNITAAAELDVERLHDWLFEKSPPAAQRLVTVLEASFMKLADLPDRGRAVALGVRELVVPFGGSKYLVRYEVREVGVFIARVWHGLEDRSA